MKKKEQVTPQQQRIPQQQRTLGPVSDLERHLPSEWWKGLFNSLYLKTDGDVVENTKNTERDIDALINRLGLKPSDRILDLCCGQGRHLLELAKRGFSALTGIDRSRYLIRLARKRATESGFLIQFSEGDARKIRVNESSLDAVYLMGNSFGYFEREEDDVAILEAIKKCLVSEGKLALDIMNGAWMQTHFEKRTWEWIDQDQFVCRERSLSSDCRRIVSREVVVHAEKGVIADQFYAERLYTQEQIEKLLTALNFQHIACHAEVVTDSTRGHDLGMMANRLMVTAVAPVKKVAKPSVKKAFEIAVLLGDPRLADPVKRSGVFNEEDFEVVSKLKKELEKLKDFQFSYYDNHATFLTKLSTIKPKLVFNLCDEGYQNPAFLDMLSLPYTGAASATLAMCYDKALIRALAQSLDIPVPEETFFDTSDHAASIPSIFPALLKPNYGDSSIGITQEAVVYNAEELIGYLSKLRDLVPGTPVLIQEFLEGEEYSVGIIGHSGQYTVLPILEVDYSKLPQNLPKILGYESKWMMESPYCQDIVYREAHLDEENKRKLVDASIKLFERTGCCDYARFDFRADKNGIIKLLEVNPNPGWCWDGKLNLMAQFAGYSYNDLLRMILVSAMERSDLKPKS
jgi:D-alanine-D-alanine ligase